MTASLYQVASSSANGALRDQAPGEADDVGRGDCRVQLYVVPAVSAPCEAGAVEQVLDAVGRVAGPIHGRHLDPARLPPAWIQVDDDHDDVSAVCAGLGVAEQPLVVGVQEAKGTILLKRGVLAADAVDLRDQRAQAVALCQVPVASLILLGVEVILPTRRQGGNLRQLE